MSVNESTEPQRWHERFKAILGAEPQRLPDEDDAAFDVRHIAWLNECLGFFDANEILYRETKNPVYVWRELSRRAHVALDCFGGDYNRASRAQLVPEWGMEAFCSAVGSLSSLSHLQPPDLKEPAARRKTKALHYKKAMEMVPMALGLCRRGWNAFQSALSDRSKRTAAEQYDLLRLGLDPKTAATVVQEGHLLVWQETGNPYDYRLGQLGGGSDPADARRSFERILAAGRRLRLDKT
ncbi:hypothetical protein [Falsiroseomonas stagni]|nr:hypothetical protein [Falsiroseomonas stagni]